jgi:folate-binding protein YgfZ
VGTDQVAAPAASPPGAGIEGSAFVRLAGWRTVSIGGADARRWLHDLVTADVAGLAAGDGRRSLLLSPTGRIRADVHVVADPDGYLLLQGAGQPEAIHEVLVPYVLSSDVSLRDRSAELTLFAVLGRGAVEDGDHELVWSPSVLGSEMGIAARSGAPADAVAARLISAGFAEVPDDLLERLRIVRAIPRMGPDFDASSLPAEAGLEDAIDFTKGCFLGQESVAKVRNLGHPRTVLVAVRSRGRLTAGDAVVADGSAVGVVTSVTNDGPGSVALARIAWDARARQLSTTDGEQLLRRNR